jgi:spore germination protein YaaH
MPLDGYEAHGRIVSLVAVMVYLKISAMGQRMSYLSMPTLLVAKPIWHTLSQPRPGFQLYLVPQLHSRGL